MVLKCLGCEATAIQQKGFKHNDGCKKKRVTKVCEKSGTAPHAK